MSVQVFFHLCWLDFLGEDENKILSFINNACPTSMKEDQGIYVPIGKTPFLEVCGRLFHLPGIPLVPIVHVNQWPLKAYFVRYNGPMESAKREVRKALSIP
jgi:hypothetical protein